MPALDEVHSGIGRTNSASTAVLGVSAVAWIALWWWQESAASFHAAHSDWTEAGFAGALCQTLTEGNAIEKVLLFGGHWLLMVIAMMVPTATPAFEAWQQRLEPKESRPPIFLAATTGYLSVWMMFGVLVLALDAVIWRVSQASPFLTFNGWLIGTAIFALAGTFQLSKTKARFLDQCCDTDRLIGPYPRRPQTVFRAFLAGFSYGGACLAVGWALMLLMFVFWAGSLLWMLIIGFLMAVERRKLLGVSLHRPLGCALLVTSLGTAWIYL